MTAHRRVAFTIRLKGCRPVRGSEQRRTKGEPRPPVKPDSPDHEGEREPAARDHRLVEAGIIRPVIDWPFPFESTNETKAYVEAGRPRSLIRRSYPVAAAAIGCWAVSAYPLAQNLQNRALRREYLRIADQHPSLTTRST